MDWSEASAPGQIIGDTTCMCNLVYNNFLLEFIYGPTHTAGNTLGLLFCNYPDVEIEM